MAPQLLYCLFKVDWSWFEEIARICYPSKCLDENFRWCCCCWSWGVQLSLNVLDPRQSSVQPSSVLSLTVHIPFPLRKASAVQSAHPSPLRTPRNQTVDWWTVPSPPAPGLSLLRRASAVRFANRTVGLSDVPLQSALNLYPLVGESAVPSASKIAVSCSVLNQIALTPFHHPEESAVQDVQVGIEDNFFRQWALWTDLWTLIACSPDTRCLQLSP